MAYPMMEIGSFELYGPLDPVSSNLIIYSLMQLNRTTLQNYELEPPPAGRVPPRENVDEILTQYSGQKSVHLLSPMTKQPSSVKKISSLTEVS